MYELLDLNIGKCQNGGGGPPEGYVEDPRTGLLRVATKVREHQPRIFTAGRNRDIEIIKLNGSIELAPLLGLSDVIVDIVETGSTLARKPLEVCWKNSRDISAQVHRERNEL